MKQLYLCIKPNQNQIETNFCDYTLNNYNPNWDNQKKTYLGGKKMTHT